MNINRHNYEAFFLLYIDNELSPAERTGVEEFVRQNPDLRKELQLLHEFKLTPENNIVFSGKDSLLKPESMEDGINASNYETFFVLYNDDELNNDQKAVVEEFVYRHPQYQSEFELLQQVRMEPDMATVFPNKELLYRKEEEDDKVVPFRWWRLAVAAILLLIAGLWWLNNNSKQLKDFAGKGTPQTHQPAVKNPTEVETNNQPAVVTPKEDLATKENKDKENTNTVKPPIKEHHNNNKENKVELANNRNRNNIHPFVKKKELIQEEEQPDRFAASKVINRKMPVNGIAIIAANPSSDKPYIIEQEATITKPGETKTPITYASLNSDNVEVLNTSVSGKNNLRGFLRKASRFIAKKSPLSNDDGNRKGILIGGFEIAAK